MYVVEPAIGHDQDGVSFAEDTLQIRENCFRILEMTGPFSPLVQILHQSLSGKALVRPAARLAKKLDAIVDKIGYPDKWRDYSKVAINRGKYFENLVSCAKNEYQYQVNKVGNAVDKTEWQMTPPTINA